MKKLNIIILVFTILALSSCFDDLNTIPIDESIQSADIVYGTPKSYLQGLAKLYAGFAVSGQEGPAGKPDIKGIDEGFGQYLRGYFYHQELTTDEAIIAWNDQTIRNFHTQTWNSADGFTYAFYSRIFYQISICNEFLRQTTDAKLDDRNTPADLRQKIKRYRAEARIIRAISYWHGLDLFRNTPFGTEEDPVGTYVARQTNANELFNFIESEILAVEDDLLATNELDGGTSTFGRINKACAWTLLAKLYLNSEVYIGKNNAQKAVEYCEKVINSNAYSLEPEYANLFLADNHKSKEIIFPISFDGIRTKTWGGTTFIIRGGIGGSADPVKSGVASGWGGTRTTRELIKKFPEDLTGIISEFNPGKSYGKVYIPGSFQASPFDGLDTKNRLTEVVPNSRVFEGYRYFPEDNTTFVVLPNPSSTLGGKLGDNGGDGTLEINGANIVVNQKGFYYIKVDLRNRVYELKKQDWSVIGSAITADGNTDIPLTWNNELGYLTAKIELREGWFKFRANNSWDVNLGDTGPDGILDAGGDNINITKPGGYEIRLDLTSPDYSYELRLTGFDRRGIFYTEGQNLDINDVTAFTDGYAVLKFKNVTSTGERGSNVEHVDTDFPMFRLGDVYLMAAEGILRSGGDRNKAVEYFNTIRQRAYKGSAGNISASQLDLNLILDERARELYWECHRRTDLIRFGQFTDGDYVWQWKGGEKDGAKVPSYRNIFPIPENDRRVNPNLQQNPGYN